MKSLFALVVGIFSVAFWPVLPPMWQVLVCVGVLAIAVALLQRWVTISLVFIHFLAAGILYAVTVNSSLLKNQLPVEYDKHDFIVTGTVSGIPEVNPKHTRFYFNVSEIASNGSESVVFPIPAKLRLNWYQRFDYAGSRSSILRQHDANVLAPQQQWRLKVRLRRPRGSVNPGGFDYQAWLLRQGITATGYVRDSHLNSLLGENPRFSFDVLRYKISNTIDGLPYDASTLGLLKALTVGYRQQISASDWHAYSSLGLAHLLVISGLHVGLAAVLAFTIAGLIARMVAIFYPGITAQYWSAGAAIIVAAGYSSLAGWSIPTQRAFVMVAIAALFVLLNRSHSKLLGFTLALTVVALLDPLAVWSAGFWLSFVAVAILLWFLPAWNKVGQESSNKKTGWLHWFFHLFKAQLFISMALLPWLILLRLPFSPLMPLVNLVAIPWISFLVVPLCLLGAFLLPVFSSASKTLWSIAAEQLQWFSVIIRDLNSIGPTFNQALVSVDFIASLVLLLGIFLMLLPKGLVPRLPGILLITGALLHEPERLPLQVTVLDVGQGSAAVVHTANHTLVYDAGPSYSDSFNAGTGIVAPYLGWQGVSHINALIISHDDNDHAGGAVPLEEAVDTHKVLADPSMVNQLNAVIGKVTPCQAGESWMWDDVNFHILAPEAPYSEKDNNRSCVLLISYKDVSVLLPGDIEQEAEQRLLENPLVVNRLQNISLLLAPHHGSKTSSSPEFVQYLKPDNVIFSAGYQHHFGHPHQAVVDRYMAIGSDLWNTANSGALQFRWDEQGSLAIIQERERVRRFWFW